MVEAHRLDAWLSRQNWDLSGSRHNSRNEMRILGQGRGRSENSIKEVKKVGQGRVRGIVGG